MLSLVPQKLCYKTLENSNKTHQKLGTGYSRMDQVKFFKDCLPQILLGPFLNTL